MFFEISRIIQCIFPCLRNSKFDLLNFLIQAIVLILIIIFTTPYSGIVGLSDVGEGLSYFALKDLVKCVT